MSILGSYGWMLLLASIATYAGSVIIAKRLGLSSSRAALTLLMAGLATVAGARLLDWITRPPTDGQLKWVDLLELTPTGFSLYGGLILGLVVGGIVARLLSVDSLRLADSATIPIALGIAIIRIGCLQRGCCFGKPTDLLWSIIPAPESPAYFHQALRNPVQALMGASPIHPTQLYELLAALLVAAVAFFLIRGQASKGTTSLVAAIIFTSLRWLIFPLREVQSGGEFDAILFPVLYPCLLVALVLVWLVLKWPISGQVKCAPARPE